MVDARNNVQIPDYYTYGGQDWRVRNLPDGIPALELVGQRKLPPRHFSWCYGDDAAYELLNWPEVTRQAPNAMHTAGDLYPTDRIHDELALSLANAGILVLGDILVDTPTTLAPRVDYSRAQAVAKVLRLAASMPKPADP